MPTTNPGPAAAHFAEVEVELKSGSDEAATAFAKALATKYRLIPESRSKYKRALALTGAI